MCQNYKSHFGKKNSKKSVLEVILVFLLKGEKILGSNDVTLNESLISIFFRNLIIEIHLEHRKKLWRKITLKRKKYVGV